MRRLFTLVLSLVVVVSISGVAAAQGRSNHGKPSQTGLEHAETEANSQGVQRGIENAEAKQAKQDNDSIEKGKSKHKKHHRKKHSADKEATKS